jgi:beta-phosphoglucomutase-like phosphatase (HAD superfamily)
MHKITGLIYDFDGTIVSTVGLHEAAWKYAGRKTSIEVSEEFLVNQKGIPKEVAAKMLIKGRDKDINKKLKKLVKYKRQYVAEHTSDATVFKDFLDFIPKLLETDMKYTICTSATCRFIDTVIDNTGNLAFLEDKVICKDMYKKGKPDPEPLFLAMREMHLKPRDCIYVGDAFSDYKAAKNAKCRFVYYWEKTLVKREKRIPEKVMTINNHSEILRFIEI